MLGTVPQHKEWGDTNNSYGWNWNRSTWFPVCNPNMTNRKWTSIYRVLLYFNWSSKAFFSYEVLGKEHCNLLIGRWSTLLPQPPYSRYYSHCLLFYCEICVVLFKQNPKISNHVKPSSCWSKSSLSADQTVSIYYLQVKMKLATVGNI